MRPPTPKPDAQVPEIIAGQAIRQDQKALFPTRWWLEYQGTIQRRDMTRPLDLAGQPGGIGCKPGAVMQHPIGIRPQTKTSSRRQPKQRHADPHRGHPLNNPRQGGEANRQPSQGVQTPQESLQYSGRYNFKGHPLSRLHRYNAHITPKPFLMPTTHRRSPCITALCLTALCLTALFLGLPAQAALDTPLPLPIAEALARVNIPAEAIGLWVQPGGQTAPSRVHQEQRAFNPASVMKLVTTLAALDRFGPAHTFQTEVLADGLIQDGILNGSLYIRGGGDPTLTTERASALLRALRARGLQTIRGDLVLDGQYYALSAPDPAEFDGAAERPYNAPPAALLFNYNTLAITFTPQNAGIEVRTDPSGLTLKTEIRAGNGACNGWQERLKPVVHGRELHLQGDYPQACGTRTAWFNLLPPAANNRLHLASLWQELGGHIDGQIRDGTTPDTAQSLLKFASRPLAEIVRDINKHSNNVMTRMLFLNLGASQFGAPATPEKAQKTVDHWLAQRGLTLPGLVMDNGAGLSREARLTPAGLGQLLHWARAQPWFFEFAASLPALGIDGTLQKRSTPPHLIGRAYLKTGSLRGVRAWAGYLQDEHSAGTHGGHTLVLMINHPNAHEAGPILDSLLNTLTAPLTDPNANPVINH